MKIIRQLFLVTILTSGCLFIACDLSDPCNCPPIDGEFFNINGLFVKPVSALTGPMNAGDEVAFADFRHFNVEFQVNYISQIVKPSSYVWINSADACSCVFNGISGAKNEGFETIQVTTLNDYDDTFKAGAVINSILTANIFGSESSLNDYLQDAEGTLIQSESIALSLDRAPTANKEVRLGVYIELTNGEVYELETVPVVLN